MILAVIQYILTLIKEKKTFVYDDYDDDASFCGWDLDCDNYTKLGDEKFKK
eukprot:gene10697-3318_t